MFCTSLPFLHFRLFQLANTLKAIPYLLHNLTVASSIRVQFRQQNTRTRNLQLPARLHRVIGACTYSVPRRICQCKYATRVEQQGCHVLYAPRDPAPFPFVRTYCATGNHAHARPQLLQKARTCRSGIRARVRVVLVQRSKVNGPARLTYSTTYYGTLCSHCHALAGLSNSAQQ